MALLALGAGLLSCQALAQSPTEAAASATVGAPPPRAEEADGKAWSFSASAYSYFVPEGADYIQPTLTADCGRWHLEARYNYEEIDAGSLWVGYTFRAGDTVAFEITPMLGGIMGRTSGLAPGYKATLSHRKMELYTEGEYVFDRGDASDSFFYTWSELTLAPLDWLRFGLVLEGAKVARSDFEIQRGFLVAFTFKQVTLTTYLFNPDARRPTLVLALSLAF